MVWSWLLWLPVVLSGHSQLAFPGILLYALGGLGPPVAAIFLIQQIHPPEYRRDYGRRVIDIRRISPVWYAVIFLLPLAMNILAILTGGLLGAPLPSLERGEELLTDPLSILPFALVVLLFGPLPEELGWRGYALDGLQERLGALSASLVLGTVWALWHWPQFFMQDSYIGEAFPFGSTVFWAGWVLPTIAYSIFYTWIYNHTGRSILGAILLHFMANFWGELLAVRGETVIYRSVWTVTLAIAVVSIWGSQNLRLAGRDGQYPSSREPAS